MPETDERAARAKVHRKTWLIVVVACCAAALGAGIVGWVFSGRPAQAVGESAPVVQSTLTLDTFVVNLKGNERAYLRTGMTLALARPLAKNKQAPMALIRDTILDVLTMEKPEQLLQPEGKRQLKLAILAALTERAPELGVKDVYFTEFLVQM